MSDDGILEYDLYDDPRRIAEEVVRALRVAKPALVTAIARDPSRITAALMVRFVGTDLQARAEPEVQDVPIVHYSGGGYGAWMDLRVNDPVVVACCDGPVRPFYETGEAVTPIIGQGHDFGCALAFPGGRVSATDQPTPPPNAAGEMLVGAADGSAAVVLRAAGIASPTEAGTVVVQAAGPASSLLLGSTSSSFAAALADPAEANFQTLNNAIQAWTPIPNDGGASLKAVFTAWAAALQNMADAKVRMDGPA